jgi:uncharacterized membrane protein
VVGSLLIGCVNSALGMQFRKKKEQEERKSFVELCHIVVRSLSISLSLPPLFVVSCFVFGCLCVLYFKCVLCFSYVFLCLLLLFSWGIVFAIRDALKLKKKKLKKRQYLTDLG